MKHSAGLASMQMLIADKSSIRISSCHKQGFFDSRFQAGKTGTYLQHTTNSLQKKITTEGVVYKI